MTKKLLLLMTALSLFACTKKKVVPIASANLAMKAEKTNRTLLEIATEKGFVRVLLILKVSFDPASVNAENISEIQKEIREVQNEVLKAHFVNAENPKEGRGFTREVRRYDVNPKLAVNVNAAELEALAANPMVVEIQPDGFMKTN